LSRRRTTRGRRASKPLYGGLLPWLLALPARLRIRGVLILTVLAVALGAYGHVLVTAPPMPPGQAPLAQNGDDTPGDDPSTPVHPLH
jgi:hypothetical protein